MNGVLFSFCSAIKDGYESDSTLVFKKKLGDEAHLRPQTPQEARSAYNQIQRGGDIPLTGLRMSMPEKKGKNVLSSDAM